MYDINMHRHNFASWAAARAVNRAFTTVLVLKEALEACGVFEDISKASVLACSENDFKVLHRRWCEKIMLFLINLEEGEEWRKKVTYGRAAKLVAVYIKSMVVLGGASNSNLASVAHPPVDRILLQQLAKDDLVSKEQRAFLKKQSWTQFGELDYYKVISLLRSFLADGEPFWMIEKYWSVTG